MKFDVHFVQYSTYSIRVFVICNLYKLSKKSTNLCENANRVEGRVLLPLLCELEGAGVCASVFLAKSGGCEEPALVDGAGDVTASLLTVKLGSTPGPSTWYRWMYLWRSGRPTSRRWGICTDKYYSYNSTIQWTNTVISISLFLYLYAKEARTSKPARLKISDIRCDLIRTSNGESEWRLQIGWMTQVGQFIISDQF